MRILSLNVWGGNIYEPLTRYLEAVDADVYCLQEVVRTPGFPGPELIYRDGDLRLPQRTNLFDDIDDLLPGHDGRFYPVSRGPLFDESGREFKSEFGLATFVRRSLPVISEAMDFVHGEFSGDGWGAHPRSRNAHCFRLFDAGQGTTITLAHMHGMRELSGKHDTPLRERQAERLVELIRRVWPGNEPLVVCGDFNVLPGSLTFDKLSELDLADLVTGRGHTDTRTSLYEKPGRFADYMLVNGAVDVLSFEVVAEPEVSDHRALLLETR